MAEKKQIRPEKQELAGAVCGTHDRIDGELVTWADLLVPDTNAIKLSRKFQV